MSKRRLSEPTAERPGAPRPTGREPRVTLTPGFKRARATLRPGPASCRLVRAALLGCALISGWSPAIGAQEMALTPDEQMPLFDRILTYDKNFVERVRDELVVGILYQRRFGPAVAARDEVLLAVQELDLDRLGGVPVRFVTLDLDAGGLARRVEEKGIDYLYVTPLRAPDFEQIVGVCDAHQVTTLTGVPEYVEDGLGIGLGVQGGRLEIVVNLPAARASGSEFSAQLLQVATVYN